MVKSEPLNRLKGIIGEEENMDCDVVKQLLGKKRTTGEKKNYPSWTNILKDTKKVEMKTGGNNKQWKTMTLE